MYVQSPHIVEKSVYVETPAWRAAMICRPAIAPFLMEWSLNYAPCFATYFYDDKNMQ